MAVVQSVVSGVEQAGARAVPGGGGGGEWGTLSVGNGQWLQ
jgi:hypothetical protein